MFGVILQGGQVNIGCANCAGGSPLAGGYSTANVTSVTNSSSGSFTGFISATLGTQNSVILAQAYSSGFISGGTLNGGFVGGGNNLTFNAASSFWNTITTGQANSYGNGGFNATAVTSIANMQNPSTFSSWGDVVTTPSTTSLKPSGQWFMYSGQTYPLLLSSNTSSISSPEQLQLMGATLRGVYTLDNNVDLSPIKTNGSEWGAETNPPAAATALGAGFVPVGTGASPFTGYLNGNGFIINNLYENVTSASTGSVGLFGTTGNASTLRNVRLTNANITIGSTAAPTYVGVLAGLTGIGDLIVNDYSSGTISSIAPPIIYIGGLIGYNQSSISSYSTAAVTEWRRFFWKLRRFSWYSAHQLMLSI